MPEANRSMQSWIFAWLHCKQRVDKLKNDLRTAEEDLVEAEANLGAKLAPHDMKLGEKVGLWGKLHQSGEFEALFVVELDSSQTYHITMRGERETKVHGATTTWRGTDD